LKKNIFVVSAIQTVNDSSLWWAHGWKDRHKTLYDVTMMAHPL